MAGSFKIYSLQEDGTRIPAVGIADGESANLLSSIYRYSLFDNYVDNSNFCHWVAQAGIGGTHGQQAYGGDRWILDEGTIEGTGVDEETGYQSIILNGTIRQIIANPLEVMTPFIHTINGTAEVNYTYTDGIGELTITSAGATLDWVMLLPGNLSIAPVYVPKRYAEELAECKRYYQKIFTIDNNLTIGTALAISPRVYCDICLDAAMRVNPTLTYSGLVIANNSIGDENITNCELFAYNRRSSGIATLRMETSQTVTTGSFYRVAVKTQGYIEFNADL